MKYFAVPIFATVAAETAAEAETKKRAIESLLQHEMLRLALASEGVTLEAVATGELYQCEPPRPR